MNHWYLYKQVHISPSCSVTTMTWGKEYLSTCLVYLALVIINCSLWNVHTVASDLLLFWFNLFIFLIFYTPLLSGIWVNLKTGEVEWTFKSDKKQKNIYSSLSLKVNLNKYSSSFNFLCVQFSISFLPKLPLCPAPMPDFEVQ